MERNAFEIELPFMGEAEFNNENGDLIEVRRSDKTYYIYHSDFMKRTEEYSLSKLFRETVLSHREIISIYNSIKMIENDITLAEIEKTDDLTYGRY